jgi:hypothetical protein
MADQEKFVENDKKLSISVLSGAAFCRRRFKKCLKILRKHYKMKKGAANRHAPFLFYR